MQPSARMAPAALALLVFLLVPAAPSAAARHKIGLKVSTHSGQVPLFLEMDATLSGFDLAQVAGCRVRIDRSYRPAGTGAQTIRERLELPCVEQAGSPLTPSFRKEVTLKEEGDYAVRLIITPASGRDMAGTVQEVKVYSTWEAVLKGARRE